MERWHPKREATSQRGRCPIEDPEPKHAPGRGTIPAYALAHDRPAPGLARNHLPRHTPLRTAPVPLEAVEGSERNRPLSPGRRGAPLRHPGPRLLRPLEPLPPRGHRPRRQAPRFPPVPRCPHRARPQCLARTLGGLLGTEFLQRRDPPFSQRHRCQGRLRPRKPRGRRPRPLRSALARALVRPRAHRSRRSRGPAPQALLRPRGLPSGAGIPGARPASWFRLGREFPRTAYRGPRPSRGHRRCERPEEDFSASLASWHRSPPLGLLRASRAEA